jgi:hypothetical protein
VYELRAGQVATGQVWSEAAFTIDAMTFPALDVFGLLPKNLPPFGITGGRRGSLLGEREQRQNHEKGHCHAGRTSLSPIDLQERGIPYI